MSLTSSLLTQRALLALLCGALLLGGTPSCRSGGEARRAMPQERYALKGRVIAVDRERRQAAIEHEEIPGYMERMTMTFPVRDERALATLAAGDRVRATLVVANDASYWLEDVAVTAADEAATPGSAAANGNRATPSP